MFQEVKTSTGKSRSLFTRFLSIFLSFLIVITGFPLDIFLIAERFHFRNISPRSLFQGISIAESYAQESGLVCPPPSTPGLPYFFNETYGYCMTYIVGNQCPSPYVFDSMSGMCISYPVCLGGYVWDSRQKACVPVQGGGSGSSGGEGNFTFSFDQNATYCASDLNGDGEVDFNLEVFRCIETSLYNGTRSYLCPLDTVECDPQCSNNGTAITYNGQYRCSYSLSCPSGYSYNSTLDNCTHSPYCPSGSIYNRDRDRCERSPQCLPGETLSGNSCIFDASISCPQGTSYDSNLDRCVSDVLCPAGTVFNPNSNRCEGSSAECPPGGWYDPSTGMCIANEVAIPGSCTGQTTGGNCINVPYTGLGIISVELSGETIRIENFCNGAIANSNSFSVHQDFNLTYCCFGACAGVSKSGNYLNVAGVIIPVSCSISCPPVCQVLPGCSVWNCVTFETSGSSVVIERYSNGRFYERLVLSLTTPQCGMLGGYAFQTYISGGRSYLEVSGISGTLTPYTMSTYELCQTYCNLSGSVTYYVCSADGSAYRDLPSCQANCFNEVCPSGYTYSGTQESLCVASPICPSGTYFDSSTGRCWSPPICPSGTTYDAGLKKCVASASVSCPRGYFDPAIDRCRATPVCSDGMTYNQNLNICESDPTCLSGGSLDKSLDLCISSPSCPENSVFDPSLDACISEVQRYTCPYSGKECLLDPGDNRYKCSPHDCLTPQQFQDDEPDEIVSGMEDDAGYDEAGNCLGTVYIFSGTRMRCRPSGVSTGFQNCCDEARGKLYDSTGSFPGLITLGLVKDVYKLIKAINFINSFKHKYIYFVTFDSSKGISQIFYTADGVNQLVETTSETIGKAVQEGLKTASYNENIGGYFITSESTSNMIGNYALRELGFTALSMMTSMAINDPTISSAVNLALYSALVHMNVLAFNPVTFAMLVASFVMSFFQGSCDEQDVLTSTLKESGYCHYVGSRCIKKWPLVGCVQKIKVYCCFNSKLARIIHEQGRPQLSTFGPSGGWGSARRPNCRGFTPEEFQAIDFGRIDFSEYVEDIQRNLNRNVQQQMMDLFNQTMQYISPTS